MPTVMIDFYHGEPLAFAPETVAVVVDVIRATTTIATAVSMGRRCFPVSSWGAAQRLSRRLNNPLLAGELSGDIPYDFEMNNSPAELAKRSDITRPLILLSSSGTRLIEVARPSHSVYMACLRDYIAVARELAAHQQHVMIVGAGTRGEFREEDQMCSAWIAMYLLENGFTTPSAQTRALVKQWQEVPVEGIMESASADFLIRTGQVRDLEFILSHVGDLDEAYVLEGEEVVPADPAQTRFVPAPQAAGTSSIGRQTL